MARFKAYRNLNRRDGVFYSLAYKSKVIGYYQYLLLNAVDLKHANPNALQRIRSGPREVCAWMLAEKASAIPLPAQHLHKSMEGMRRLSCDPKKVDHFCDAETGERVDHATFVVLCDSGTFYTENNHG